MIIDCLPECPLVDADENGCGGTCECGILLLLKQQSYKNLNQKFGILLISCSKENANKRLQYLFGSSPVLCHNNTCG